MAAGITLAKAISTFESELGCGGDTDRDTIIDRITEAVEFMMHGGGGDILREWRLPVMNGRFTLPRDLLTPVKYKFGDHINAGFGTFYGPYLSYSSYGVQQCCGFADIRGNEIAIQANTVVTQFYPPKCGVRLLATTRNEKDVGTKIIVGGKHHGMEIAPLHKGHKTSGELLTVYHEEDSNKKYSSYEFDEITSLIKEETCDYVMLSGLGHDGKMYHLGFYHPDETIPRYTEGIIRACCGFGYGKADCEFYLHILGRVDPSTRYIRDEDILPIQTLEMLRLLAKRARYEDSNDFNELATMEQRIQVAIRKTLSYQNASARQLSFSLHTGGATLTNM